MQSNCPPAALSRTGAVLVWIPGAVAGALRICEQPGAAAQAQLARGFHGVRFRALSALSGSLGGARKNLVGSPIIADELLQSGPV